MCASCFGTVFGRPGLGRRGLLSGAAGAGAVFAAARATPARAQPAATAADLLIENARVLTLDPAIPAADAIAIAGDRILRVGARRDMTDAIGPATRVIDAGGRTVIPGLNDSHCHLIRGGLTYSQELRWDGVPSLAVALRMLREQAQRTPAPHWVQVMGGWTPVQFAEQRLPTLDEINAATGDVPCYVMHIYDRAFVNRAGLRVLGIGRETPDPFGGTLGRDEAGNPTGLVVNVSNIGSLLGLFARIPKLQPADQMTSTRQFMRELNRFGITSASDAGGGGQNYPVNYGAIQQLAADKQMTVRIGYSLFAQRPGHENDDYRQWVTLVKPGDGDDYLRMEGAGEYMIWAMHDPANFSKDVIPPKPADEDALVEAVKLVVSNGWPFRLHANYDVTVQNILRALERANRDVPLNRVRWIIDHAETISPRSLERVAAMGGSIAVQNRMTLDGDAFAAKWGKDAAADAPPIGRIRSMGLKLAAGTDGNRATSHNPWVSIAWLVTGRTIGGTKLNADRNLVSREEALRLWTAGSWFTGEEDRKGTLTPGKWADLAVLSDDPLTVPEDRLGRITSVLTLVGGRPVHGEGSFAALAPAPLPVVPDWLPIGSYPSYAAADVADGGVRLAMETAAGAGGINVAGPRGEYSLGCLCGLL